MVRLVQSSWAVDEGTARRGPGLIVTAGRPGGASGLLGGRLLKLSGGAVLRKMH